MRAIKFRFYDKKNKRMEHNPLSDYRIYEEPVNSIFASDPDEAWMQYIGLKDKNGVEIYEGDIVAIDMWHGNEHGYIPEDGVIRWYQPSAAFKWFSLEEDQSDGNNYWLSQADEHQREVIGNIYENPELLK